MAARGVVGALIFSVTVGFGGGAVASPLGVTRLANPIPKSTAMTPGGAVLAPVAAVRFCMDNVGDCEAGAASAVAMTPTRWAELDSVNRSVNGRIRPRSDAALDTWSLGVVAGDCDDYAVQKRHDLIAHGWPGSALPLAVARLRTGEFHLVVVARTDRGDYVLDNLFDRVMPWQRTGHDWIMRSAPEDLRLWQSIGKSRQLRSLLEGVEPRERKLHADKRYAEISLLHSLAS
ncbi:hypothetical protein BLTE_06130 [Blastochloris tepida]|uniref:Transglutaminase n=1 Tax=Blastochloris tepida TaxID=2233851 RepID=A0A348FX95_9HYPH|nr:hypothetical protein BLTE_06130 [Blastochloris tepida]